MTEHYLRFSDPALSRPTWALIFMVWMKMERYDTSRCNHRLRDNRKINKIEVSHAERRNVERGPNQGGRMLFSAPVSAPSSQKGWADEELFLCKCRFEVRK